MRNSHTQQMLRGPVYNAAFLLSHGDTIFIGAGVVEKGNKALKEMPAMPPQSLARFQFLEAFVRVAVVRYLQTGEKENVESATKELMTVLNVGQEQLQLRSSLQKALFSEECCMVLRQNLRVLEDAFAVYGKRLRFVGRTGSKAMTYGAWLEFLQASNAQDFGLGYANWGLAFALGKEVRVDELKTFRHMELSWSEFLVCVGAAVRLSGDFNPNFFPDRLLDTPRRPCSPWAGPPARCASRWTPRSAASWPSWARSLRRRMRTATVS